MLFECAVEGDLDEVVLKRVAAHAGATIYRTHGLQGKDALLDRLDAYNESARWWPWIVLIDLDERPTCAPAILPTWLPVPAPKMCFRIVVRAIESWLLADHNGIARLLGVAPTLVPRDPDALLHPKTEMINLGGRSPIRKIRTAMVPRSGSQVGIGYNPTLIGFVRDSWDPAAASQRSDSLRRCIERIQELVTRLQVVEEL